MCVHFIHSNQLHDDNKTGNLTKISKIHLWHIILNFCFGQLHFVFPKHMFFGFHVDII